MNRRQRRETQRRLAKVDAMVRELMTASENDGKPWHLYGMTHGCRDCNATVDMHGNGRTGPVLVDVWHDDGCPAKAGVTQWQPVPV